LFAVAVPLTASGGPAFIIYRASGVFDNGGGSGSGTATLVHCTNASGVPEDLLVVVRQFDGSVLVSRTVTPVPSFRTVTLGTHSANTFPLDTNLATGGVDQGMVAIGSTTTDMFCSFMVVDAASTTAQGISLHLVRYNSSSGTQE
jgi:hypothetical protein